MCSAWKTAACAGASARPPAEPKLERTRCRARRRRSRSRSARRARGSQVKIDLDAAAVPGDRVVVRLVEAGGGRARLEAQAIEDVEGGAAISIAHEEIDVARGPGPGLRVKRALVGEALEEGRLDAGGRERRDALLRDGAERQVARRRDHVVAPAGVAERARQRRSAAHREQGREPVPARDDEDARIVAQRWRARRVLEGREQRGEDLAVRARVHRAILLVRRGHRREHVGSCRRRTEP